MVLCRFNTPALHHSSSASSLRSVSTLQRVRRRNDGSAELRFGTFHFIRTCFRHPAERSIFKSKVSSAGRMPAARCQFAPRPARRPPHVTLRGGGTIETL